MIIMYPIIYITVVVTDSIESLLLIILHWSCVIFTIFICQDLRHQLASTTWEIENEFHFCNKIQRKYTKLFRLEISFLCVFLLVLCISYITVWTRMLGFHQEKFVICKEIQIYISVITVYQLYYFNLYLKSFFQTLNAMISRTGSPCNKGNVWNINKISKLHHKLCDAIDMANSVYGYPILILITFLVVRIIATVNLSVMIFKMKHPSVAGVYITWTVINLVS